MIKIKYTCLCFGLLLVPLVSPALGSSKDQQIIEVQNKINKQAEFGQPVKTQNKEKPDIIKYLDGLKKQTTMIGGKVYIKNQSDNSEEGSLALQLSSDIVNKAQQSILRADRERLAKTLARVKNANVNTAALLGSNMATVTAQPIGLTHPLKLAAAASLGATLKKIYVNTG